MSEAKQYVTQDNHGVLRIGQTRVSLDSVVYRYLDGDSAEAIRQQFPALSLEEVHGALAYYLANRDSVHKYLEREKQFADELRRELEQNPRPVVERLRAIKASKTAERQ